MTLRWATAGHPVPLIVGDDGNVHFLTGDVGPPVVMALPVSFDQNLSTVAAGQMIVLYTDGLVEREESRSMSASTASQTPRGEHRTTSKRSATTSSAASSARHMTTTSLFSRFGSTARDQRGRPEAVALITARVGPDARSRPLVVTAGR